MNNKDKEILKNSIIHDDDAEFIETLNNFDLVLDESFSDYELLKVALDKKRGNIAKILIRKGSRVRNPNKTNLEETPLHLAMKLEDLSVVSAILNNNALLYDKNLQGDTPLHAAFKERYYCAVDTVLDYITNCDLSFNPKNNDDIVHFHIACIRKHINSIKLYLSLGFDVNSHLSIDSAEFSGLTPLYYLLVEISDDDNFVDLFEILLNYSDLTIKNIDGLTVLQSIYYNNCLNEDDDVYGDVYYTSCLRKITTKVFKYGNNTKFVNAVDSNGVSHFHLCCSTDRPDWVKVFIDSGVDVNSSISLNCSFTTGYTPLHIAVKTGCLKIVELLLKNGADCNRSDNKGATPLYLACFNYMNEKTLEYNGNIKFQHLEIMKLLLENGADCNKFNNEGVTPLHFTVYEQDVQRAITVIKLLLEYSACPVSVDELGNSPIHLVFERILDEQNEMTREGRDLTELFYILDMLLSKAALTVNLKNKKGLSIFHIICTRNCPNQVNEFLNSGTAIDSCVLSGKYKGYTALHFAVLFNQKDVVEVLLKKNAQVNIETYKLDTPLHIACKFPELKFFEVDSQCEKKWQKIDKPISFNLLQSRRSQLDIIKLLLLREADVDTENLCGNTPLLTAYSDTANTEPLFEKFYPYICNSYYKKNIINEINTRIIKITNILVSNKANVNACTNNEQSIFHLIVNSEILIKISEYLVECLVSAGADINAADVQGLSPLHFAAAQHETKLVQIMLKYKANINVKCKNFQTPLEKAIDTYYEFYTFDYEYSEEKKAEKKLNMATITLLLDSGSDINERTKSGKTLLYDAILNTDPFVIEELLYYGGDINVKDSLGNSLASILLTHDELNCSIEESYIIFIHVQKLLALGLYVNDKVQKFCNYFRQYYKSVVSEAKRNRMSNVFNECIDELKRMKNKKIDKYTSLYDILLKNPHELSKNVKNKALRVILEEQDTDLLFPLYSYLLKLQYKKGLIRSDVLKDAKRSLIYVLSSNLPDPCYDSILCCLTNKEIVNLKEAVAMKGSSKRKLSNGSHEAERSTKLRKKE